MVTAYFPLNATCPQTNFEDYAQVLQNQEFDSDKWDDVVFRLGFCGAKAVPLLKEALDVLNRLATSNNSDIEDNGGLYIIKALGQIGKDAKDAVPELTTILENEKLDDYLQYHTVNTLGKIGSEAKLAIPSLRKLLESTESSDFVIQLIKAIGLIGETEFAVSALLKTIETTETLRSGQEAALALVELIPNNSDITDSLVEIIQKSESNESRVSAALGLFAIGIKLEDTSTRLIQILKNEQNSAVLISTTLALLTGNADKAVGITAIIRSIDNLFDEEIEWNNYDASDPLLEMQLTVARALSSEMSLAIPYFIEILSDKTKDPLIRKRVIKVLGVIETEAKDAVTALIEIVKHKREEIALREEAITTLGAIGSEARDSVNQLIQVVEDEQEELYIRSAAVTALGKIGADAKLAIPILLKFFIDNSITSNTNTNRYDYTREDLSIVIAEALGKLGETQLATTYLLKIVADHRDLGKFYGKYYEVDDLKFDSIRAVGFAFQRIGFSALPSLVTALVNSNLQRLTSLLDSDLQRRRAAVYGLAMIGQLPNEAINILIPVVHNEREDLDVRRLAAYALENSGIDVQEFFNKMNLAPVSKAVCRDDLDFFDIYLGLCVGVPKNGGAALLEWIKEKLGG